MLAEAGGDPAPLARDASSSARRSTSRSGSSTSRRWRATPRSSRRASAGSRRSSSTVRPGCSSRPDDPAALASGRSTSSSPTSLARDAQRGSGRGRPRAACGRGVRLGPRSPADGRALPQLVYAGGRSAARRRSERPTTAPRRRVWSRCGVIPPRKNGQPAPSSRHVSTSAASATTPSSSRCRISSAIASSTRLRDLLDRPRRVARDDDLARCPRRVRQRRREREAVADRPRASSRARGSRRAGRRSGAAPTAPSACRARAIASSVSSTVLPCSSASMSTLVMRVSTRLTTKPGASRTTTPRLRSFLHDVPRRRERLVARLVVRARSRRAASPRPG